MAFTDLAFMVIIVYKGWDYFAVWLVLFLPKLHALIPQLYYM